MTPTRDSYDGVSMEYFNPATEQPPISPTMWMPLQVLEDGEYTEAHKHNSVEAYYVIQSKGKTKIDGESIGGGHKDIFILPCASLHSHEATAEAMILFAVSYEPIFHAFDLYREADDDGQLMVLEGSTTPPL